MVVVVGAVVVVVGVGVAFDATILLPIRRRRVKEAGGPGALILARASGLSLLYSEGGCGCLCGVSV